MKKLINFIIVLPLWFLMVDLWYSVSILIYGLSIQDLDQKAPKQLPVAPEIAFSSMQVMVNTLMAIIVTFGLLTLIWFNHKVSYNKPIKFNGFKITGLLIAGFFSLPGLWTLFWNLFDPSLYAVFSDLANNVRYTVIAFLLPYPFVLLLYRVILYFKNGKIQKEGAI
ncbi:hypothetical protein [Neisseria sp. Ec49-e6-T10]|uniref:hypothetical protein n=1 Tax=Neisseria sp. Ec49-e6-T10 TaxID=3140744 RepID=UPI003EBEEDE7